MESLKNNYTPLQFLLKKLIFFSTKYTRKYCSLKTDIILYYLWSKSVGLKLCNRKLQQIEILK